MHWSLVIALGATVFAAGCGKRDYKEIADRHVNDSMLGKHEKREAISFFEQSGRFYRFDTSTTVDQEVVLPMLRRLREIAATDQWVTLRPEDKKKALALLVRLPQDAATVDRMALAVEEADAQFSGLILQQWGRDWLMMDLIDQPTYEFLKQNDPEIDKQR